MNKKETEKLLRDLYDKVGDAVKNIYTVKPNKDDFITLKTYWITFGHLDYNNKEEVQKGLYPNIYIGFLDEARIGPDGATRKMFNPEFVNMGISYETKPLVADYRALDHPYNAKRKDALLSVFKNVLDGWSYQVYKKTRMDTFRSIPTYESRMIVDTNKVTEDVLKDSLTMIDKINKSSHKRGDQIDGRRVDYQGASLTVITKNKIRVDSEEFVIRVRELFAVLTKLFNLNTMADIKGKGIETSAIQDKINFLETIKKSAAQVYKNKPEALAKKIKECNLEIAKLEKQMEALHE